MSIFDASESLDVLEKLAARALAAEEQDGNLVEKDDDSLFAVGSTVKCCVIDVSYVHVFSKCQNGAEQRLAKKNYTGVTSKSDTLWRVRFIRVLQSVAYLYSTARPSVSSCGTFRIRVEEDQAGFVFTLAFGVERDIEQRQQALFPLWVAAAIKRRIHSYRSSHCCETFEIIFCCC